MAMAVDADRQVELEADLQELRAMLQLSKRPSVQLELQRVQAKLEKELSGAQAEPVAEEPSAAQAKAWAAAQSTWNPAASSPPASKPAETPVTTPAAPPPAPTKVDVRSAGPWTEITTFEQNLGGYDKPHVTVDLRLKGVESIPRENITCDFTDSSFDLKVMGLDGKNHRFVRTNLDKDISPVQSEVKVKKNHVIVQLAKVKGQYGFDTWTDLVAKGRRKPTPAAGKEADPQASIMNMMQDLYDDGDDSMKKIIGEAMYKSKRGEKMDSADLPKSEMDM